MPSKTIVFSPLPLGNVGCEIIVRGTVAFLQRGFPETDLSFVVPSYRADKERALLADLPQVQVVPMLGWKRILRGVLRKSGLFVRHWSPRYASRHFREADLFCSIGGDIYTIFDGALPLDWLGHEAFATRRGIPSIMFGANMERFEVLSDADRKTMTDHLARFCLLAVRDEETAHYLSGHGLTGNTEVFPDPMFLLRPRTVFEPRPVRRIGINFSPFMTQVYGEAAQARFATLIEALVDRGYAVTLLPHVASDAGVVSQHDPGALAALHAALPAPVAAQVTLWDKPLTLETISAAIAEQDMVIGARMHCCLNALTQGKAVLFAAYSQKAQSMVRWLKQDTPFAAAAASYDVRAGDQIDIGAVLALIASHDAWSKTAQTPLQIDTEGYLQSLPIWDHLRRAVAL